jgi:exodeoxyribonuclease VII large subunit
VQVFGKAGVYANRGSFQFNVDYLEDAGEGVLRRRFEELKARLLAEGLFDSAVKRPLPELPRRIGLITSPAGAAIRDILHILKRRFPAVPVVVYPVAVQGAGAAADIARALQLASERSDADVLILARGGGSLEDLWSFNEEIVARAIRACRIPVVSGVGHETDTTIADFAADLRAPTPSGAAEQVVPDQAEWKRNLSLQQTRLGTALRRTLKSHEDRLAFLARRLEQAHPRHRLRDRIQRLDELEMRLSAAYRRHHDGQLTRLQWLARRLQQVHPGRALAVRATALSQWQGRLQRAATAYLAVQRARFETTVRTLHAVSPLATVERGYAIVTGPDGRVIRSADAIAEEAEVLIRLANGQLQARVTGRMD